MLKRLVWTAAAWEDYLYWQTQDRKTLKRINLLIQDAMRSPFGGIGKPEPLKENLSGFWSRRIDDTDRLVYSVEKEQLEIVACRFHY
jgi:toxin YoeB